MGVVYVAHDLGLDRDVALKLIRGELGDPRQRDRFRREARAAAAFNHPNICHLYEISEHNGELFIAMELLEGQTLAQRIAQGPLTPGETARIGIEILNALAAIHARGFVHRDIKPSNVFLLNDRRVKLLDFGLVFPGSVDGSLAAGAPTGALTMSGMVLGSPRYMAPEQIRGAAVDHRADLFALGAVLHEALTGRPVFGGDSAVETMYAVMNERPSAIGGSPAHIALGRVIERALAKPRNERPPDSETFASALREALAGDSDPPTRGMAVERVMRLAVLPFRLLRPDPEKEFLSSSLADAIAMSLAGIRSLIVRSTMASARFSGPSPDLREIASSLDVDVVLAGTVLPAGTRCRVAAQLVEAPSGEVVWSQTLDVQGEDIFQVQDTLTKRIVESLQLPLSARERGALGSDVPASAAAYELFLRANRIGIVGENSAIARELYQRAIESDPNYAPAWARLGRCQRVLGKYFASGRDDNYRKARSSLNRALDLHPDLPSAQYFLAQLELDRGQTHPALDRLLAVIDRNPNDPNGYAGLVTAFRYVGLLEESLAAHRRAKELDPEVATSVHYTLTSLRRYEEALDEGNDPHGAIIGWLHAHLGRDTEGIAWLLRIEQREANNMVGSVAALIRAAIENDRATGQAVIDRHVDFPDPEGLVLHASAGAKLGLREPSIDLLVRGMTGGYANPEWVRQDAWFTSLLDDPRVVQALAEADAIRERARVTHGGRLR